MYYNPDEEHEYNRFSQVLEIPVTDFELSVRSRNCLKKMNIRTLGDLTRVNEQQLLSSKNFGETSLQEIKEMMTAKGLRLGQSLEEGSTLDMRFRPQAAAQRAGAGRAQQAGQRPEPVGAGPQVHEPAGHQHPGRAGAAQRERVARSQELRPDFLVGSSRKARADRPEPSRTLTHQVFASGAGGHPTCPQPRVASGSSSANGRTRTPRSARDLAWFVDTPVFMPVGTQATVKGLSPEQVAEAGATLILANTYHLALRPGSALIAQLGGLHRFMSWTGPILTDSGGFQLFSLAAQCRLTDQGALFRSHIDGALFELTPERAIEIQEELGADIIMCLDECPAGTSDPETLQRAVRRTVLWAERCRACQSRQDQALFGIVQGGTNVRPPARMCPGTCGSGFSGLCPRRLQRGRESRVDARGTRPRRRPRLPEDKPRYLMGVGRPVDLLGGVAAGIDMFDCVLPTRNGRNASAFTMDGSLRLRNACFTKDPEPLERDCPCYTCRHFSRAYLHHLFQVGRDVGTYFALAAQCRLLLPAHGRGAPGHRRRSFSGLPGDSPCPVEKHVLIYTALGFIRNVVSKSRARSKRADVMHPPTSCAALGASPLLHHQA